MSDSAVIGVHGLLNKPEATVLQGWWRDGLTEGLRRNRGFDAELPPDEGVIVQDHYIKNTYQGKTGKPNNHKSYGYLRAPEFSDLLADFLGQ